MFYGESKSAKGGPNPLADMDRGGPNPRGVQIRCDAGIIVRVKSLGFIFSGLPFVAA